MRFQVLRAAVAVLTAAFFGACAGHGPRPVAGTRADVFTKRIRPILEQHCTPCHFAGGKMHDRLPFDDPAVVRSKPDGILRRLKDPQQHQVVEDWIRTLRP